MSRSRLANYLRTERLRSGLSQRELADVLGMSRSAITKMESARAPTLHLVLAAEIVFGRAARDFIPGFYAALQDDILLRAVALEFRLSDRSDPVSLRKRAYLGALINRLQFNDFSS